MPGKHWRGVLDLTWLPDGSGLLLAALPRTGTEPQLWMVTYPGGAVRRISNDLSRYLSVAISADGRTIASVQMNITSSLWVGPAVAPDQVRQITSGRLDGNSGVTFTPVTAGPYVPAKSHENRSEFDNNPEGLGVARLSNQWRR